MKILNAEARRYLHQVRSWLPCSRKPKERILEEISVTLTEFLSSNSSVGYADFIARFGTPQQSQPLMLVKWKLGHCFVIYALDAG